MSTDLRPSASGKAEHSSIDDVIDLYKRDVDRSLLRENLKLDSDARSRKFERFMAALDEIRGAASRT